MTPKLNELGPDATLADLRQHLIDYPVTDIDFIIGEIDPKRRKCEICLDYELGCRETTELRYPTKKWVACEKCRTKLRNMAKI